MTEMTKHPPRDLCLRRARQTKWKACFRQIITLRRTRNKYKFNYTLADRRADVLQTRQLTIQV